MRKSEYWFLLSSFIVWRSLLFFLVYLSINFLPLGEHFLGGGKQNFLNNPYFWSWGNFDGEHYLSIAQQGYKPLTYFFFPFYPLLIKSLGATQTAALLISNTSFLLAILGFYKLVKLDFSEKVSKLAVIFLLTFPTSFFFASAYTESLFLALVVWSFYLFRKNRYFPSVLLATLASATKIIGVILLPIYMLNIIRSKKFFLSFWLLIIPIGLLAYMFYLFKVTGDPLNFFNTVNIFGEQRSTSLILFPQVFYRYLFKILPSVVGNDLIWQIVPWLEFVTASLSLLVSVYYFYKVKIDYASYVFLGFLIPSLSGSFSSFPRYILVLFPVFIFLSCLVEKTKVKYLLISFNCLLLIICTSMFVSGYWVS